MPIENQQQAAVASHNYTPGWCLAVCKCHNCRVLSWGCGGIACSPAIPPCHVSQPAFSKARGLRLMSEASLFPISVLTWQPLRAPSVSQPSRNPVSHTIHVPRRFSGNIGQAGGGLFQQEVEGLVDQCAFEDNTATNSGAGVSQSGGSGNVTNCIFINNQVPCLPLPTCGAASSWLRPDVLPRCWYSTRLQYCRALPADNLATRPSCCVRSQSALAGASAVETWYPGAKSDMRERRWRRIQPSWRCKIPMQSSHTTLSLQSAGCKPGGRAVPEQPDRRRGLCHFCWQLCHTGLLGPGGRCCAWEV